MAVPFTQYLRPNGRKAPVTIERPPEIEALARRLIEGGCTFELELLSTGVVSMECVGPTDEHGDPDSLAVELVPNGPGVPPAVDRLVADAVRVWATRGYAPLPGQPEPVSP